MKKSENLIPLFKVFMSEDVIEPLNKVLMSGFIGQGPVVEKFEKKLIKYFNNYLVATTNAATSGLHLSYRILGIPAGSEVLTTALTCTATNWPILANNLKIKWVDVDPETCNMDLDDLERKLSPTTKAICVVHWGGYPTDLDRLKQIQEKSFELYGFKPPIIEDCAHSFGSTYKNTKLGNHGNVAVFSFQAIKHLTTGDGGVMILPDKVLYDKVKLLRWYGIDRETNSKDFRCEDDIAEWGYKFHMNDINATIGLYNFDHVVTNGIKAYQDNTEFYDQELKSVPGVTILNKATDRISACWIHTMKVENRDNFMRKMKECNIMVSRVHERNDKHSCVKDFKAALPNLDKLAEEMICIPNGWWIGEEERGYIVDCIKEGW